MNTDQKGPNFLSQKECTHRIIALHETPLDRNDKNAYMARMRAEQEIRIDHLLGFDFPKERRDALWEAKKKIDRQVELRVLQGILLRPWNPAYFLVRHAIKSVSAVLTPEETDIFLGLPELGMGLSGKQ